MIDLSKFKRLKAKIFNKDKIYPNEWQEIERPVIPTRENVPPLELWFIKTKKKVLLYLDRKVDTGIKIAITRFLQYYGLPLFGLVVVAIIVFYFIMK